MNHLLNEDQQDCLRECINIAYGKATSHIATILDAFATMSVPSLQLLNRDEMDELMRKLHQKHGQFYLSIQRFKGDFEGESVFMIDQRSTDNLLSHLKEQDAGENHEDSVIELTNVVTSSLISEMAQMFQTQIFFKEPFLRSVGEKELRESPVEADYQYIILINTLLAFEEQDIHGEVFILMHEHSFQWLKGALDRAMDELF